MPWRDTSVPNGPTTHQAWRQADFFLGFAQGGFDQVVIFRVAAAAGKGDFAAMGGQAAGAQREHHFGFVAAGDGHQHRGFWKTLLGFHDAWAVTTNALE